MGDVLLVSGTRPEIIKLAPLYHAMRAGGLGVCWLHTGQHDEMARQIQSCFDIVPDIVLRRRGSTLAEFTVECRQQLEPVMRQRPWAAVIVQGDTESAFQGALAAFYNRIPVGHVEAGLRTYNLQQPFPEEAVRQMISRLTRLHFAPTERARQALLAEGIEASRIFVTGNTVVDAQHWTCAHKGIRRRIDGRGHLLVTVHRRENWGPALDEICTALGRIAAAHPELAILFPVHPNPVIREPIRQALGMYPNVRMVPPLDYLAMQQALADAWLVLTDSGGLQEEAPTFGVPLFVLRDETERPEAVEAGCAALVGTTSDGITARVEQLWRDPAAHAQMQRPCSPFGDGTAAATIVGLLEHHSTATTGSSHAAA